MKAQRNKATEEYRAEREIMGEGEVNKTAESGPTSGERKSHLGEVPLVRGEVPPPFVKDSGPRGRPSPRGPIETAVFPSAVCLQI